MNKKFTKIISVIMAALMGLSCVSILIYVIAAAIA